MNVERIKAEIKRCAVNCIAASVGRIASTPGRLRILTFHDVGGDAGDVYAVTKERFAEYLSLLKDEGYTTIKPGELAADWPAVASRNRVVLLTFDDGYAAHRDVVADILARHGMTATFFAVSSFVERARLRRVFSGKERQFLCSEDLRQMALGGFEIGSHSHTHALLGAMPAEQIDTEVSLSKRILEEAINCDVVSFSYPFGRRGAFSQTSRTALEKNGYLAAFTQEGTGIEPTSDLLELPRISVDRYDTLATFRRKLRGYYEYLGKARRYLGRA
jgi:peptidoglycan/xylan/chitin deacetylase (PgdA/CDA1 family)